jgi:Fe2+ transport system protein FeoA
MSANTTVSLAEMAPGQKGIVVAIRAGLGLVSRLDAMGIRPGTTLVKIGGSPFNGPITVRAGNIHLAVGYGMAMRILVGLELPSVEDRS